MNEAPNSSSGEYALPGETMPVDPAPRALALTGKRLPPPIPARVGLAFIAGVLVGCALPILSSRYVEAPLGFVVTLGALGGMLCVFLLRWGCMRRTEQA